MNKNKIIKIFYCSFCAMVLIMLSSTLSVYAEASIPDPNKYCSLNIELKQPTGETIFDGNVYLYHIANLITTDSDYYYEYTSSYSDCDIQKEKLSDNSCSKEIDAFTKNRNIIGQEASLNEQGKVQFTDLSSGTYLVVIKNTNNDFYLTEPLLISLPNYYKEANSFNYDVTAYPKAMKNNEISIQKGLSQGTLNKLPQTGQLWWPVPILMFSGILFIVLSFVTRRNNECK